MMRYGGLSLLVLLAVGGACVGSGSGVREDELVCEEAVARLKHCCPAATSDVDYQCLYVDGCDQSYPQISPDKGQCIMQASCESLLASNACGPGGAYEVRCP
jgi:hypothetical protein